MKKFSVFGYLVVVAGLVLVGYTSVSTNVDQQSMDLYEQEQILMADLQNDNVGLTTEMLLMVRNVVPDFTAIDRNVASMRTHIHQLTIQEQQEGSDDGKLGDESNGLITVMQKQLKVADDYKRVYSRMRSARDHMIAGIDNLKMALPLKQSALADEMLSHVLEYLITPSPELRDHLAGLRDELTAFAPHGSLQASMHRFLKNSKKALDYGDQLTDVTQQMLQLGVSEAIEKVVDDEFNRHRNQVEAGNQRQAMLAIVGVLLLLLVAWGVRRVARSQQAEADAHRELKYQKFAVDQHSIMAVTDLQGTILEVNDKFCAVSQYGREELIGQNHRMLKSGEHSNVFYEDLWTTINSGRVWHGEVCNRKKDGSLYWVDSTIFPAPDARGVTQRYIAIRTDITARKLAEKARKESEQCMQQVMESALDAIVVVSDEGHILQWNPAATHLFGYTQQAMVGKCNIDLLIDAALFDSEPVLGRQIEIEVPCVDGRIIPVEMSINMLKQGNAVHYSIFFHDIRTQRKAVAAIQKAAKEARQAVQSKSMFLSTVSHELRTPMNGVIGMSDLLMDTTLTEEQLEFVSTIRGSSEALLTIINDILDFSKIEAGKMDIEEVDFDLRSVIEGSAVVVSYKVANKQVALLPFVDPEIPPMLKGDPTRLRQIMLNLIDNAMKFTSEGHVVARADCIDSDGVGEDRVITVRFTVEDTGIGLSQEAQSKLFQPFVQADGSTTRKFGGTGLGLAICRRLVQLMGDDITLQSEEGKGSIFSFTLKFPIGENPSVSKVSRDTLNKLEDIQVLLVDDDVVARDVLSHYLRSWNMAVECAENGEQALAYLEGCQSQGVMPDLLLVDLKMPQMDGFELADRVRKIAGDDALMVLCTSYDSMGLKHQASAHGFDRVLTKPVRMSQLLDAIVSVLGMHTEPLLPVECVEPEHDTAPLSASEAAAVGRLVLLVEDNPVNQRVAQMHLIKLGYTCHMVNDGSEALQATECTPYSIVLMDCQMPVMDGFEATRAIRKREQELGEAHRVIIAMTANAMKGDRERCLDVGMDDYLSKPISRDRLQKVLDKWLHQPLSSPPSDGGVSTTHTLDSEDYINVAYVRELVGDDDEIVRELLQLFYDSMCDVVRSKMAVALENRDAVAMKAHAHELRGAAGNIGATAIGQHCQIIEKLAEGEDWANIRVAMEWLKQAHQAIKG